MDAIQYIVSGFGMGIGVSMIIYALHLRHRGGVAPIRKFKRRKTDYAGAVKMFQKTRTAHKRHRVKSGAAAI